jgi:Family of unknown function (DUF6152)
MNRTCTLLITIMIVGGIAGGTGNARAHHSFAMFDNARCVSISGTVRNFQWSFPHSWIWLNVPDRKGAIAVWGFEGEPPSNLAQYGWKRSTLKKGDKVSLRFSPLKNGQNGGAYSVATLADGTVMTGARGRNDTCVSKKP